MSKKKKIPLSSSDPFGASLENAFGGLDLPELPEGNELTPAETAPAGGNTRRSIVLRKEKARRGGKTVIVLDQIAPLLDLENLRSLARTLQTQCGCGGSVQGDTIELQGDQPARIREVLQSLGYRVRGV